MPEHGAPWPEESIKMKKLEPTDYLGTTPNCMGHCSRRGQGNARPRPTLNARYKLRVDHYYLGRCVLDNYMLIGKGGRDAATAYFYIRCPVVWHTTNHFKTRERDQIGIVMETKNIEKSVFFNWEELLLLLLFIRDVFVQNLTTTIFVEIWKTVSACLRWRFALTTTKMKRD